MKKRYCKLACVLAVGVCLVFGTLALLPPRPGVTKANFDRIENGMRFDEVNALFAKDADSDVKLPRINVPHTAFDGGDFGQDAPRFPFPADRITVWVCTDGAMAHIFLDSDRVSAKHWQDSTVTPTEKILRLVHWPWF